MPLPNSNAELARSSTLNEALTFLGMRGHTLTLPAYLSLHIKHGIPLHAVAPESWPMEVEEEEYFNDVVGDYVFGRRRMMPADCLLAVLSPHEIEKLLVRGEVNTIRPAGEGGNQLVAIRFIEPVRVTFETVRVTDRTLRVILEILRKNHPESAIESAAPGETKEQRQDRHLHTCEAAGLDFKNYKGRLPDGVGELAADAGETRQTFSKSVKAALMRRNSPNKAVAFSHKT
jgi:hypothetical protein